MKTTQLIMFMALSFVLGLGVMALLRTDKESQKATSSNQSSSEIENKDKKTGSNSSTSNLISNVPSKPKNTPFKINEDLEDPEDEEPEGPEEAFAQLLNSPEARKLMKGFAGAMSRGADRMISSEVEKQKEKLGLSDDQAESIQGKLVSMVQDETKRFQSQLDDENRSFGEIMESQGEFWSQNEPKIDEIMKAELNDDQYALYEREQLVEKTNRVQRQATSELDRLNRTLELTEEQEDQVFGILVQKSSEYDESMAIEGISATLPESANAEDISKEDAIRSVLNADQTEKYNERLENGGFGRRGGWGRGQWNRRGGFGG
ncbi:MAG: hypothetical protein VX646_02860 [Verrucomicrobiota bacterium]|nr:hypothetical protein [Verrucomicrobiota bacterium]MEE2966798.1 hypothetical protein [Verrucomicrobiota bacterium]